MLVDLREQAEKHLFVCLFFHSTATFFKALVKLHIADCALLEASLFSLFYHFHTLRCWFSTFSVCQRARRTTHYTSVAAEGHTDTKSISLNSEGRLVLVDRLRGVEFGISLTEKKNRHLGESRSSNLSTDQLSMQLDTPQSRSFCLMLSRSRRHFVMDREHPGDAVNGKDVKLYQSKWAANVKLSFSLHCVYV